MSKSLATLSAQLLSVRRLLVVPWHAAPLSPSADRTKRNPQEARPDPLTMHTSRLHTTRSFFLRAFILGALIASLLVVATPHIAFAATSASDNFNRANGSLGAGWTDMTEGGEQGLAISNDAVIGTEVSGISGDIRTGEVYTSDQFSQIQVTSTQYTGGEWIGPAVRAQNSGQDLYLGIYLWNYGNPELGLYVERDGGFTQLGSFYASGPLPAGTELTLSAIGSALSFSENGVMEIAATIPALTGGAPGIVAAFGAASADNWLGGDATVGGAYSIGGTVSGLAGTVVLENNGGDDLSISANGTFTFSPPIAQGCPTPSPWRPNLPVRPALSPTVPASWVRPESPTSLSPVAAVHFLFNT